MRGARPSRPGRSAGPSDRRPVPPAGPAPRARRDAHPAAVGWWQPPKRRGQTTSDETARHRAHDATDVLPVGLAAGRASAPGPRRRLLPLPRHQSRPSPPAEQRRRRLRLLRRALLGSVAAVVLGPVIVFAVGYLVFSVPDPDDAVDNQVALVSFADGSQLTRLVPEEGNRTKVPLEQVPEHVRHAVLSAEDRTLLLQPRLRRHRHPARGVEPAARRGRRRLDDHAAVRQEGPRRRRADAVAQVQGGRPRGQDLPGAQQGRDPRRLPQHDLLRPRRLRHPVRGAGVLRQERAGPHAARGRAARRADPVAVAVGPRGQPGPGRAALERSCSTAWSRRAGSTAPTGEAAEFPVTVPRKTRDRVACRPTTGGTSSPRSRRSWSRWASPSRTSPRRACGSPRRSTRGRQQQAVDAAHDALERAAGQPAQRDGGDRPERPAACSPTTAATTGSAWTTRRSAGWPGRRSSRSWCSRACSATRRSGSARRSTASELARAAQRRGRRLRRVRPQAGDDGVQQRRVHTRSRGEVGPEAVAAAARSAGITAPLDDPNEGIALGNKEVSRRSSWPRRTPRSRRAGSGTSRTSCQSVVTADDRVLYQAATEGEQRFPERVARNVTEAMLDVAVARRARAARRHGRSPRRRAPCSPGSMGENNDAWMAGFTPSLASSVWMGTDMNSPIRTARGTPIQGAQRCQATSGASSWPTRSTTSPWSTFAPFRPIGEPPSPLGPNRARPRRRRHPAPPRRWSRRAGADPAAAGAAPPERDGLVPRRVRSAGVVRRRPARGDPGCSAGPRTAGRAGLRPRPGTHRCRAGTPARRGYRRADRRDPTDPGAPPADGRPLGDPATPPTTDRVRTYPTRPPSGGVRRYRSGYGGRCGRRSSSHRGVRTFEVAGLAVGAPPRAVRARDRGGHHGARPAGGRGRRAVAHRRPHRARPAGPSGATSTSAAPAAAPDIVPMG